MTIQTAVTGKVGTLKLAGRFDFNVHRDFRNAYQSLLDQAEVQEVAVDLSATDYLDSAALGMLLLLKQRADELRKRILIQGAQGSARKVLEIANFGKLFTIA